MTTRRVIVVTGLLLSTACAAPRGPQTASPMQPTPISPSPSTPEKFVFTFTADSGCAALPAAIRTRTYSMETAPSSPGRDLWTLSGASFGPHWPGYATPNVIYFSRQSDNTAKLYFTDPPIVELVDPASTLMIDGYAEGSITGATSQLAAEGSVVFCGDRDTDGLWISCRAPVRCESEHHTLTLTRQ